MLENEYYIVISYVTRDNCQYPFFDNCALVDGKFYKILNLEQYLSTGNSYLDEVVDFTTFILVSSNQWKANFQNINF
ncbi:MULTISPECIES: hypothetical protein [unclassified Flavobacterium]|uniref:hypothetical protein n=1 Tax=unclassified Flavobacterium TaxID=196869 RepID=UPI00131B19A3|nr:MULTISPECIES: hypothetical protein [unclassified Flavobacterium]